MHDVLPAPAEVGHRAAEILNLIKEKEEFVRLERSSQAYTDCWATINGYPLVASWNLASDTRPLFDETIRVLALKTEVLSKN